MSKTKDLRKVIQSKLVTVCTDTFYETAPANKMYPHIVWNLERIDLGDLSRDDLILDVDIWDRDYDAKDIDELADAVEALFNNSNLPQTTILPTFFRIDRKNAPDEDKKIKHRVLTFQVQNYVR
ncbi:MAG: DUF3168 domain-containing protein [Lachnospiraceae bacterium]|nr:DUF3168 domain-containing protein [Lachnospiraceae bacterium]